MITTFNRKTLLEEEAKDIVQEVPIEVVERQCKPTTLLELMLRDDFRRTLEVIGVHWLVNGMPNEILHIGRNAFEQAVKVERKYQEVKKLYDENQRRQR